MHIKDYFVQIGNTINFCKVIQSKVITFDSRSDYIGFIKGTIYFIDDSILHFREFVDVRDKVKRYKYSYHYQSEDKLIFRYDNAKDLLARQLPTFPHHKHVGKEVIISTAPEFSQILNEIVNRIELKMREN
ncbi:MAG: DUF6516 family protein [Nitrospirota bacterium]